MVMQHGTLGCSIILETDTILAHLQLQEKKTKQKIIWEILYFVLNIICAKIFNCSLLVFLMRDRLPNNLITGTEKQELEIEVIT